MDDFTPAAVQFPFDRDVGRKNYCYDLFEHRRYITHEYGE